MTLFITSFLYSLVCYPPWCLKTPLSSFSSIVSGCDDSNLKVKLSFVLDYLFSFIQSYCTNLFASSSIPGSFCNPYACMYLFNSSILSIAAFLIFSWFCNNCNFFFLFNYSFISSLFIGNSFCLYSSCLSCIFYSPCFSFWYIRGPFFLCFCSSCNPLFSSIILRKTETWHINSK